VDGFEVVEATKNTSKDFLSADCTDFRRLFSLDFSSAFICVHLRTWYYSKAFVPGTGIDSFFSDGWTAIRVPLCGKLFFTGVKKWTDLK